MRPSSRLRQRFGPFPVVATLLLLSPSVSLGSPAPRPSTSGGGGLADVESFTAAAESIREAVAQDAASTAGPRRASKPRLVRLVVVARHSVKNPYRRAGEAIEPGVINFQASAFTKEPLAAFAEEPQQLTQQGKALMRILGGYLGQRYSNLLGSVRCEDVAAFADPVSARDVESAEAFMLGLLGPGRCPSEVNRDVPVEHLQRVFRDTPDAFDKENGCGTPTVEQLRGILGVDPRQDGQMSRWLQKHRRQLQNMQEKLKCCSPEACGDNVGACTLFNLPTELAPNVTWRAVGGPLGVASWFAEAFQMQYCNGLEAGWGLKEEEMVEMLGLLDVPFNLAGANAASSQNLGSELLWEILRAMRPSGDSGATAAGARATPAVSIYFGHDTNLQFLRRMLGLTWLSEGWWPDLAEPGSLLVFEVHDETGDGKGDSVRLLKVAATPRQQRTKAHLSEAAPPSVSELWVPGCSGLMCKASQFFAVALKALRPECIKNKSLGTVSAPAAGMSNDIAPIAGATSTVSYKPPAAVTSGNSRVRGDVLSGGGPSKAPGAAIAKEAPAAVIQAASSTVAPVLPQHGFEGGPRVAAAGGSSVDAGGPTPMAPPSDPEGGSHGTLFLLLFLLVVGCAWRWYRKQQQRKRGYEALGSSPIGNPAFSL